MLANILIQTKDFGRENCKSGLLGGTICSKPGRLVNSRKLPKGLNGRFARQPPNEQLSGYLKNNLSAFMRSTGEHLMSGAHIIQR